ncbi:MAG TPA: ornithine carbamoyltransferase [Kofleriaceae bacterium]|jgi:ornithine carbamoyltransferase
MRAPRHFLRLRDLSEPELGELLDRADALKALRRAGRRERTLDGKGVVLVFEKASTRTRMSLEAAVAELGGHAMVLDGRTSQLGRGETLADTARVLSGYADAIVFRTAATARLQELAQYASIPVINGLSDDAHPLQLLADIMTIRESLGGIAGKRVSFVGDGASNMARSFCEAAPLFGFALRIACPERYAPPPDEVDTSCTEITHDARAAGVDADVIVTDVFTSMGQEAEATERHYAFDGFQVNADLVARAPAHAIVLHCLPAHRGEEITAEVIDGPRSRAWAEAENRMHTAKALLELLIR